MPTTEHGKDVTGRDVMMATAHRADETGPQGGSEPTRGQETPDTGKQRSGATCLTHTSALLSLVLLAACAGLM